MFALAGVLKNGQKMLNCRLTEPCLFMELTQKEEPAVSKVFKSSQVNKFFIPKEENLLCHNML
jgi:hypothetical protein